MCMCTLKKILRPHITYDMVPPYHSHCVHTGTSLKSAVHESIVISDLIDNFERAPKKRLHLYAILPPLGGITRFPKKIVQAAISVQSLDQYTLYMLLCMVDKEIHDCLWHEVGNVLPHNVKVGSDQRFDDLHLYSLALGHLVRLTKRRWHLW